MKIPARLEPLFSHHLLDEVLFQLMSGKEAEVYVVRSGEDVRCAKIYKEANQRSFKQMAQYTEGRKVRNSRQARAMNNKSRYGRRELEIEWQRTEFDALSILAAAGVRVPQTFAFIDGVLLLELVCDEAGDPAPRFHEVILSAEQAELHFATLIREVVRMLCAGIIHGDLSEFNVLLSADGPVIIDLPQAVQATANNALAIFERDVIQLTSYFGRFAPALLQTHYAKEIWQIFKSGKLHPDTPLTGKFKQDFSLADLGSVFAAISDAREDDEERRGVRPRKR